MRVVSLNCSNTEIVAALGAGEMLVGADDDSDFPPELLAALPRVGRDLEIDVEKVAALRPDLVLASNTVPGHEKVIEWLRERGLPFFAPETITFEDVLADVREIARRLGCGERGEQVAAWMRSQVPAAAAARAEASVAAPRPEAGRRLAEPRPKVLVEWWPRPVIVPGRRSWVTDLLEAAGGANPFGDEPVKSRPVSDEEVVERDPDAVVICWCGVKPDKYRPEVVRARAAWRRTTALRRGRVRSVPEAFLGRPGPRLVEGYRALREVVAECREGAQ
jgi:iron complex transport system substrate-binding protein